MTALTEDKRISRKTPDFVFFDNDVAASTQIFMGALCFFDTSGNVNDGVTAAAATAQDVGVATEGVDNSSGSAGDLTVKVARTGIYGFENGGSFTKADIGTLCYIGDDQTVDGTGTSIVAGVIYDVSEGLVFVDIARRVI